MWIDTFEMQMITYIGAAVLNSQMQCRVAFFVVSFDVILFVVRAMSLS